MISGTPEAAATPDEEGAATLAPSPVVTDDSDDGFPGAPRDRKPLLLAVGAALLVAAIVAATVAVSYKGKLDSERRRDRQIRQVSASMVTALMSYDFAKFDDSRLRVLGLATGRFQKEYDAGSEPLRQMLTQTQSRSTGTVKEVFVGDSDGDSAHTIVVADQVLTGVGGTRSVTGQQLSLTLVRLGKSGWKVDGLSVDVTAGSGGNGGQAPANPATPTTVPASPPTTG